MNITDYVLAKRMREVRKLKSRKQDYETLKKLNDKIEKQINKSGKNNLN
jgi:hypothetical protein